MKIVHIFKPRKLARVCDGMCMHRIGIDIIPQIAVAVRACWGGLLFLITDVLGATAGSLGAVWGTVLGGCCLKHAV